VRDDDDNAEDSEVATTSTVNNFSSALDGSQKFEIAIYRYSLYDAHNVKCSSILISFYRVFWNRLAIFPAENLEIRILTDQKFYLRLEK